MIVLCDVDGVLADLQTHWLRLYNTDYDDCLQNADIKTWDVHKFVKPECGVKIYDYLRRRDLYDGVLEIPGALKGVQALRTAGHRVVFVTSGFYPGKVKWLYDHSFLISGQVWESDPDVIVCADKNMIHGDILIDDRQENCEKFHRPSVLFVQPWNRDPESRRIFRASGWGEVLDAIFAYDEAGKVWVEGV